MTWTKVAVATNEVPARPNGFWTLVVQYVQPETVLRITSLDNGTWNYSDGASCGPDGDAESLLDARTCMLGTAAVGSLIGKIGGSTAGSDASRMFSVGSSCVVVVGADERGPLYLTINDQPSGMTNNYGKMTVDVEQCVAADEHLHALPSGFWANGPLKVSWTVDATTRVSATVAVFGAVVGELDGTISTETPTLTHSAEIDGRQVDVSLTGDVRGNEIKGFSLKADITGPNAFSFNDRIAGW